MRVAASITSAVATVALLSGCVSLLVSHSSSPAASASADDWQAAGRLYDDAVCPVNEARDALYPAVQADDDLDELNALAANAADAYTTAAHDFLDHSEVWPAEISSDIHFLGTTSSALAVAWGKVAVATSMSEINAVRFPDAQAPYEASQRIRSALTAHGYPHTSCTGGTATPDPSSS